MTHFRFDVRISIPERTQRDLTGRPLVEDVLRTAASVLAFREYGSGSVRTLVTADWPALLQLKAGDRDDARLAVAVSGEVEEAAALTCAQLFCHDVFITFNLAAPGELSIVLPGPDELVLDASIFDYAHAAAKRHQWPIVQPPTLQQLVAWYDALDLRPERAPTSAAATAIFVLLQLARDSEWNELSVLRLAAALEALFGKNEPAAARLLTKEALEVVAILREKRLALGDGAIRITHPMRDIAQTPQDEEAEIRLLDTLDLAVSLVMAELHVDVVKRSGEPAAAPAD
jgi:hypothetical protein